MQRYNEPMTRANKLLIVITLAVLMVISVVIYLVRGSGPAGANIPTATPEMLPSIGEVISSQPSLVPVVDETPEPTPEATEPPVTETPVMQMTPQPTTVTTLRKGDLGDGVKQMQVKLIQLGYLKGTADGEFGSGTLAAVRDFQRSNNLKADGVAGAATLTALYGPNPVPKQ